MVLPFTEAPLAGYPLPLVIRPKPGTDNSASQLARVLSEEPIWVKDRWKTYGALLFRGFRLDGPGGFETIARSLDPALKNEYLGTSPRNALTPYVFTASELPPFYPIPQHLEMSFVKQPPRRLFFSALQPNQGIGGETPLADFQAVWRDLDPAVKQRFEQKGVRNIRNYAGPQGGSKLDPWKLKRWDEMFQTQDRATVEQKCAANEFQVVWKSGGRLALINDQPATRLHPETQIPTWFNHTQVFHLSAAAGEYRRIAEKRGTRYRALGLFAKTMTGLKNRFVADEDQSMHCTYGDGSAISEADMEAVRDAIWKNMVAFPWEQDDVVAIDNFRISHGRLPYQGPRVVAVAWA